MAEESNKALLLSVDCPIASLPDHLLVEIFIRVPVVEWGQLSCVNKHWAHLYRQDCLWHAALIRCFPLAGQGQRWPGPIPRGMNKRRFIALYTSKWIFSLDDELSEIVGHSYLFLKEQLEISNLPPSPGILHGTIIGMLPACQFAHLTKLIASNLLKILRNDQFISCGKSRDKAHELASLIWLAVIENLEDNHQTFILLKRLALEGDVILQYLYSRSYKVEWKIFERLFTDFRDCLCDADYYDLLACAKQKFQPIPATWVGY